MGHNYKCLDKQGGVVEEDSAHCRHRGHWGGIGTSAGEGEMVHPFSNSKKELFQELSQGGTNSMKESILRRKY